MIIHETSNEKLTPKKAANQILFDTIYGRWANGILEERIDLDFPEATDKEKEKVKEQLGKQIERIMKLINM